MFKGKTKSGAEVSNTYGFNEAPPETTWILVANRCGAKIFERKSPGQPLEFPREIACPEGRTRENDEYRDQPGRAFSSSTQSHGGHGTAAPRSALTSEVSHHEHVAQQFAKTLSEALEKGAVANQFDQLVLVAEPHFMGLVKKALSHAVGQRIVKTVERDIWEMPNRALGEHLSELVKP